MPRKRKASCPQAESPKKQRLLEELNNQPTEIDFEELTDNADVDEEDDAIAYNIDHDATEDMIDDAAQDVIDEMFDEELLLIYWDYLDTLEQEAEEEEDFEEEEDDEKDILTDKDQDDEVEEEIVDEEHILMGEEEEVHPPAEFDDIDASATKDIIDDEGEDTINKVFNEKYLFLIYWD